MSQFTQKYAIIQLFEDMPVGTRFSASNWPLHSTVVDTFATDWDASPMIEKLTEYLRSHSKANSVALNNHIFGENGQVEVVLLEKTKSLEALHNDVIELLEKGGWKPNDPQFAHDGFLPHSTVQSHTHLKKGDTVEFDALSVVDFFPDGDPYMREILATIRIGN